VPIDQEILRCGPHPQKEKLIRVGPLSTRPMLENRLTEELVQKAHLGYSYSKHLSPNAYFGVRVIEKPAACSLTHNHS
jgi:hypothetical protein